MATISKAEYLQRYLSSHSEKKKKKKRPTSGATDTRTKIIDDDLDLKSFPPKNVNNTLEDDEDDAPVVAEFVDERPEYVQQMEKYREGKWKAVNVTTGKKGNDDSNCGSSSDSRTELKGEVISGELLSKRRRRHDSDSDQSLQGKPKHNSVSDQSQHRSKRHDSGSDQSPPRRQTHNSATEKSPPKRQSHDSASDHSPPRRQRFDSDSDQSLPRRQRLDSDSDQSPPRRQRHEFDSDQSPPRRKGHDSDLSSRSGDSNIKKNPRENSTVSNKKSNIDSDQSPPRKKRKNSDSDQSPPRRQKPGDQSTRRGDSRSLGVSRFDKQNEGRDSKKDDTEKMQKTLSGKKAGLSSAKDMREEAEILKRKEDEAFNMISLDKLGKDANTVFRDKFGRKRNLKNEKEMSEEERKREEEKQQKYKAWSKGLRQQEEKQELLSDHLYEASKPLARHKDDEDLDQMMREQDREGDPMLSFIKKKKNKDKKAKERPKYQGAPPPPNRFGIAPGYRWDGVDRSNGFEKQFFQKINEKKAMVEVAYKWSTEDM